MGKAMLKAIAAIGSGGVTALVIWLLSLVITIDPSSVGGGALLTFVGTLSTWVVAKAVAATGPAPTTPDAGSPTPRRSA